MEQPRTFADPDVGRVERVPGPDDQVVCEMGTVLTCDRGHPQYRAASAIYRHQIITPGVLEASPFQRRPYSGMRFRECMCGAPWFRIGLGTHGGTAVHLHCDGLGWVS